MRGFRTLYAYSMRVEMANVGRLLSPLFFGLTLLVLFSFAFADLPPEWEANAFVSTTTVTAFLSLQLAFARAFEIEESDRLFDYLRSYPISGNAWFLAKFCHVLTISAVSVVPVIALASIFFGKAAQMAITWQFSLTIAGVFVGLASIGVLLATITLRTNAKQILFPLLYFPLVSPILIAAVESAKLGLDAGGANRSVEWLCLVGIFDLVYFMLGIIFFEDMVRSGG